MNLSIFRRIGLLGLTCGIGLASVISANAATILYQDQSWDVPEAASDSDGLWMPGANLVEILGAQISENAISFNASGIEVPLAADSKIQAERDGAPWINATALAAELGQALASDEEHQVWSLGPVPAVQSAIAASAMAPDFELPNREGEMVRLSDLRGKKVLLLTWASW